MILYLLLCQEKVVRLVSFLAQLRIVVVLRRWRLVLRQIGCIVCIGLATTHIATIIELLCCVAVFARSKRRTLILEQSKIAGPQHTSYRSMLDVLCVRAVFLLHLEVLNLDQTLEVVRFLR